MKDIIKPSESELAILQILWQQGGGTVKEVNEALNRQKTTGYTTTLKIMQIMHEKGLLTRSSEGAKGRSHRYTPAVKESQVSTHLLENFVQRVFQGSTAKLVMRALGRQKPSAEEIAAIKKYLDEIEKDERP